MKSLSCIKISIMKNRFFLFAFLFFATNTFAQTAAESYDKGLELKDSGKYEEAIASFKNAISLDANYTNAYYQLAWCSDELEQYNDALDFLEKYNPDNDDDRAVKYTEIGYAHFKLQEKDEAVEAYNKALEYHPNFGVAYRGLGNVYYDNSEDEDAIKNYKLAMQYDEENSKDYYYTLGWLYNDQNEFEEAEEMLLKAVAYDPGLDKSHTELAYTYYKLGDFETGIEQAQKAIEINSESALAYHYLGNCYYGLGEKDKALETYNKLKSIDEEEAKLLLDEIK